LQGEATALERKALEIAEGGNVPLLKFFLARIMPRERLIKLDLPPMKSADDAVTALGAIALAMSEGVITPSEGAAMAMVVNSQARAIDGADLVKRLEVMEARYKGELMS
jgi:hypothetical protein